MKDLIGKWVKITFSDSGRTYYGRVLNVEEHMIQIDPQKPQLCNGQELPFWLNTLKIEGIYDVGSKTKSK